VEKMTGTVSLGGLLLTNGCQVIHVPSYLQGLWEACQELSPKNTHWRIDDPNTKPDWKVRLEDFDTVVLSAGSGLFHDSIVCNDAGEFPVDLVRGQSIEMSIDCKTAEDYPNEAILCGKYFTPIPNSNKVLIGATHEYKSEAFDAEEVVEELKSRSYDVSPFVWDNGSVMRMTCGYRVQTRRGNLGRMPIIGQMKNCDFHDNAYVFTGLSARGLIYHGMYGDLLSSMIVAKDESLITDEYPHLLWWKQ
jgi:glycine/D-amino acid oxidase-like deaminating enzyme